MKKLLLVIFLTTSFNCFADQTKEEAAANANKANLFEYRRGTSMDIVEVRSDVRNTKTQIIEAKKTIKEAESKVSKVEEKIDLVEKRLSLVSDQANFSMTMWNFLWSVGGFLIGYFLRMIQDHLANAARRKEPKQK